jgi:hypothetical protein
MDGNRTDGLEELLGPGIGHNQPSPLDPEYIGERVKEEAAELLARGRELLTTARDVPDVIEDEETCGKAADLKKALISCERALDKQRANLKDPYLAAGRVIDGQYKKPIETLQAASAVLGKRLTVYQNLKAERQRRAREAEARRAAEEAAKRQREAEERAKAIQTEQQLEEALQAEDRAAQAEAERIAAEQAAKAKAADLSRSRGDLGAVASLRETWVGEIADRDDLDLAALRPHIPLPALEQAVRAFVRAGGRELRGARIFKSQTTVVR